MRKKSTLAGASRPKRVSLWQPAIVFVVFSFSLSVGGFAVYQSERGAVERAAYDNLSAIARLKAEAIRRWASEREGDAQALSHGLANNPDFERWIAAGKPGRADSGLMAQLHNLDAYDSYWDVAVSDPAGRVLLETDPDEKTQDAQTIALAHKVAITRQAQLTGVLSSKSKPVSNEIRVGAPVFKGGDPAAPVTAVVILSIDPRRGLAPLIEWWPGSSPSASTRVTERSGNWAVYVIPPPHTRAIGGPYRVPISSSIPAAAAARGFEGVMETPDYRGVPVFAATTRIRGTPWALAAKIDRDEVSAPLERLAVAVALEVGALVLAFGLAISAWLRRQQAALLLEQSRAESEQAKLQQRLSLLSKYANDIIMLIDGSGRVARANDRAAASYGLSREQLLGKPYADLFAPGAPTGEEQHFGALGAGAIFESVGLRSDGLTFPVEISLNRFSHEGQEWLQPVIRDISERKQAEHQVAASAAILKATRDLSPDGMLVVDRQGQWLSHNRQFIDMWGVPARIAETGVDADAVRSILSKLADPDAFVAQLDYLGRNPGESVRDTLLMKDGRTFARNSAPLVLDAGEIDGRVWFFRDITDLVTASRTQARLSAIVESSQDAVFSMEPCGVVLTWNASAERMYGYTAAEMIGQSIHVTEPADRPGQVGAYLRTAVNDGVAAHYETVRLRKDGSLFEVAMSVSTITNPDGDPVAVSVIARDITDIKTAERNAQRATMALNTLSRVSTTLVHATDIDTLYQQMCNVVVGESGYLMAWIGLRRHDPGKSIEPVAVAGKDDGYVDGLKLSWGDGPRGRGPTGTAARKGTIEINCAFENDPRLDTWRNAALDRGYRSSLSMPLKNRSGTFGVLTIYAGINDAFGPDETRLLSQMADEIAFGVSTLANREARDRLAAIVESSQDAIIATDRHGLVTAWNQGATTILGYTAEEVIGRKVNMFVTSEQQGLPDLVLAKIARGESVIALEIEGLTKHGRQFTGSLTVSPTFDLKGNINGAAAIARDITDKKRIEQQLIKAARSDSLTGLPNRDSFVATLDQAIDKANRWGNPFAVLFMDLDHFKDVNDTLGHPVGDRLLQGVADRLRGTVRDHGTVARFGGDEFAIVAADGGRIDRLVDLAERILAAANTPFAIDGMEIRSGASLGITVYGGGGVPTAETLLTQADIALYRAKAEGRGTFRIFTEAMDDAVRERVALGGDLRAAIEANRLFLHYQPQVDAMTGRLIGMEALARWHHKERGMISPGIFVPLAEHLGLSVLLGNWVINEACRQIRAWVDDGITPPRVGINLSVLQFKTPGEIDAELGRILARHRVLPNQIELELTESVLMEASGEHGDVLKTFRDQGYMIAIDDFGTGYSSLNYLRQFKVDRIKIDQNFVKDLGVVPECAVIVEATIGLARALGLQVIAEGVETRSQRDLLADAGCHDMQGYYYARPVPAGEIARLIRTGAILPENILAQ